MIHQLLEQRLRAAISAALPDADTSAVLVRPCPDPKFGDYQTNSLMSLAKQRRLNPRQLATDVLAKLEVNDIVDPPQIAGAGFINFRLKLEAIAKVFQDAYRGEHLFFQPTTAPRTIVVDFSSPNVAKAMHVGHIRSTSIGDSLARVFRLLGHKVITDNHIGDWGTQFGKLIVGWKRHLDRAALDRDALGEMERLYKLVNAEFEASDSMKGEARQELVKLQEGDPENLAIWKEMISLSLKAFDQIYHRLGVSFDFVLGESFYNPRLKNVVTELREKGVARESEGAIVAFFDENPELKDHPALIQKSDGAANYTTTDLATLQHRLENWAPEEIVYVTDARQQLHFKQLFAIFSRWKPAVQVKLSHVWFGMILGPDGKPFKTRTGENVKLNDLLDEAEERAYQVVSSKNPELPEEQRREIAKIVGIGAIKYSDLLPNRQSDYTFDWDKMLALSGNTAPYLQYAYTRVRSIFRKGGEVSASEPAFLFEAPEELALARHLLNFGLVLESVAAEYRPNYLCNYLYELATHFARFYENCPVLKADGALKDSRVGLCDLTGRVLKTSLDLLGIRTTEIM